MSAGEARRDSGVVDFLRVTIVSLNYRPEQTGNAPYVAALAEGLVARGHVVTVLTTHPHYPEWRIQEGYGGWRRLEHGGGVKIVRFRHYVPKRPTGVRRLLSEISAGLRYLFARWHEPDVVFMVSPALFSTWVANLRARWGRARPRLAIWVQDLYSLGMKETETGGSLLASVMRVVESTTLRRAQGVVTIHDRFSRYAVSELGVRHERLTVIRNWTHVQPAPTVDRAAVRLSLGWSADEIVVLHAGNQGLKQGLENVVRAAGLADRLGSPVRFVMLGSGNQRSYLEQLSAGVDRIDFLDSLPEREYQSAMASADVLLVNERPGLSGMSVPSKLTSYFSTGLPVIAATDIGSVTADEIALSECGIRVPAGDPSALLDGVLMLGRNRAHAAELGQAGLLYRKSVLSESAAIDQFDKWLRGVVTRTRLNE